MPFLGELQQHYRRLKRHAAPVCGLWHNRPLLPDTSMLLRHAFTPILNRRLQNLCGPGDSNLRDIELALQVKIAYRAEIFRIEGLKSDATRALLLLKTLYASADRPIADDTLQLMLVESLRHAPLLGAADGDAAPNVPAPPEATPVLHTRRHDLQVRTPHQHQYLQQIASHDLSFGIGPAGTGKTYLAVASAVDALERGLVQRIVLTRPAVEAGERLGFLPGDLAQKIDPYLRPLYDALYELMGSDKVQKSFERNVLEVAPLAFMRGRTLNKSFVILDEAQNTTPEQMKMFLTRLGFGSKAVVTGDISQIDLPKGQQSGLIDAGLVLRGQPGIAFTRFDNSDVVRHPLVARIVQAYDAKHLES